MKNIWMEFLGRFPAVFLFLFIMSWGHSAMGAGKPFPETVPDPEESRLAIVLLCALESSDPSVKDTREEYQRLKDYFAEKYPERRVFRFYAESGSEIQSQLRLIGDRKISHLFILGHGKQNGKKEHPESFLWVGSTMYTFGEGVLSPSNPFSKIKGQFTEGAQLAFSSCQFVDSDPETASLQQATLQKVFGIKNGDIYCNVHYGMNPLQKVKAQALMFGIESAFNGVLASPLMMVHYYALTKKLGLPRKTALGLTLFDCFFHFVTPKKLRDLTSQFLDANHGFSAHVENEVVTDLTPSTYEDAIAQSEGETTQDPFYELPHDN